MDITFNQYISNPMGKNNAIMSSSSREFMKMRYKKKFDNLMLRENGKIEFHLYTAPNNVYWIYVKIPSEVVKKFYYDVLIKFTATEKVKSGGKDLFEYNKTAIGLNPLETKNENVDKYQIINIDLSLKNIKQNDYIYQIPNILFQNSFLH